MRQSAHQVPRRFGNSRGGREVYGGLWLSLRWMFNRETSVSLFLGFPRHV